MHVPGLEAGKLWMIVTDPDRVMNGIDWAISALGALIGAGGLILRWRLKLKQGRAESWPMVSATIDRAVVISNDNGYYADLLYSYSVNGDYFSGAHQKAFRREKRADEFTASVHHQQVWVRYRPEDPQDSLIREQDNTGLFLSGK